MFTTRKHQVLLGFFAALLLIPTTYADVLVVLEGIDGESTVQGFPGAPIEAENFDWGLSRPGADTGYTATRISGAPSIQALRFSHYFDKASPKLMEYCATGKTIPRAIVAVQKTGRDGLSLNYFVIELKNVMVTAVQLGGTDQSGLIVENVSLTFGEYKVKYTQSDATGKSMGTVETSYNIATQKM